MHSSPPPPLDRRDRRLALLLALVALLVYNANLRLIGAGDSYPARFIPFALWGHGTVYLDPVLALTIQAHPSPYWVRDARHGHKASMYAVATPVLVAPLYLPAVAYLHACGWTDARVNQLAFAMEKIAASVVASLAVGWMYLLLRRRVERRHALLATVLFAFGTTTWSISSQALWQHGPAELLLVAALWFLTGEPTRWHALAAGLATGLVVANRPPDLMLALALGVAALFWAGRTRVDGEGESRRAALGRVALFAVGGALPVALTVAYNLVAFAKLSGGYGQAGVVSSRFFSNPPVEGIAGLLVSPARGLFVFSPFLLFLPLFFHRVLRDRSHRLLDLALTGGVVLLLLVYATVDFRQGFSYGPRFLTDALPILVWLLAPVLPTLGRASRTIFLAAGAFSIWVQFVGAFQYNGVSNLPLFERQYGPGALANSWKPRYAPFLTEARNPRAAATVLQALRSLDEPPPAPALPAPAGTPSLFAAWQPPRTAPASDFYTLAPCRLIDTSTGPPLSGASSRVLKIAGAGCSIPPSAVAVSGNFTVLGQSGQGILRIRADVHRGWIEAAFAQDAPRSLHAILALSPEGDLTAVVDGAAGTSVHVQLDVNGYFAADFPKP